jgi:hypothetical protein
MYANWPAARTPRRPLPCRNRDLGRGTIAVRDDTEQPQEDRGGRRGGVIRIDRPDDITSKLLLRKRNISPFSTDRQLKPELGLPELSI